MSLINSIVSLINYNRLAEIDYFRSHPLRCKKNSRIVRKGAFTEIGKKYNLDKVKMVWIFLIKCLCMIMIL